MKKVLRAIGGFFAKIGRWIANTAWIQPLLIVGGIFAIIFSIPYIKKGIEGLANKNSVDTQLAYYTSKSINLDGAEKDEGSSDADKLFDNLSIAGNAGKPVAEREAARKYIKDNFGEKFFLTFADRTCTNCKDVVDGYLYFEGSFYSDYKLDKDPKTQNTLPNFGLKSIMIDTVITDEKSSYYNLSAAQVVLGRHQAIFDELIQTYVESEYVTYNLFKNIDQSKVTEIKTAISNLSNFENTTINVPLTFLIDISDRAPKDGNVFGITAVFTNINSLIKESSDNNRVSESLLLRDCWTYSNAFSADGKTINYYIAQ